MKTLESINIFIRQLEKIHGRKPDQIIVSPDEDHIFYDGVKICGPRKLLEAIMKEAQPMLIKDTK